MLRDGSAQPAVPTARAGTPAMVVLGGTGCKTTEPAAIREHAPISILPRIFAPAPIMMPWRTFGCRSPASLPVPPRVKFCRIETSSSITQLPCLDFVQTLDIAQALQASGWTAPADAWMLDDPARLIAELPEKQQRRVRH